MTTQDQAVDVTDAPSWAPLPPWQASVAQSVLADRARWPHAMLISGRRGLGKRLLAMHFARSLLCEAPQADGSACGVCTSCRYVASGVHPDLRIVEPVIVDDEGNVTATDAITVERIRDVIAFTQLSTHRHRGKVVLIAPAEAMNVAAANALLKTLEEPPADTYMLLVSHQPARLPATIVSRCRRLAAPEPDAASAAQWLAERVSMNATRVLAQAGGAPLFALTLADENTQRDGDLLLGELMRPERLSAVAVGARVDATPKDERKAAVAAILYWLLTWTADLASVTSGGVARFHPERGEALLQLAARVARVPLFRYYHSLLRQRALLAHPLQPRLVIEALIIEYRTLFARS